MRYVVPDHVYPRRAVQCLTAFFFLKAMAGPTTRMRWQRSRESMTDTWKARSYPP